MPQFNFCLNVIKPLKGDGYYADLASGCKQYYVCLFYGTKNFFRLKELGFLT
jgi:hypothetical protein